MVLWFCVVARVFCLVVRWVLWFCVVARLFCLVVRWCYGFVLLLGCSVWLLGDAMVLCGC